MSKTSKKDFRIYKKAVKKYCKKFKVCSWHIYFSHVKTTEYLASVNAETQTRSVTFFLAKKWGGVKPTKKRLKEFVKHEVVHLLLDPNYRAGWNRFGTEAEYLKAHEAVAQHLTGLL